MRIGELKGMPMVSLAEGTRLGKLKGVEVDVREGFVRYLRLDGEGGRADGMIPWNMIHSFGKDAVTVDSAAVIRTGLAPTERDCVIPYVGDRPVVTESGTRLGTIEDYEIEIPSGRVLVYHLGSKGLINRLTGHHLSFPHAVIRTFGRDAIIVADEVAEQGEEHKQERRAA
jgi:sporulation protein YlmC with PRC-barrel domain